MDDHLLIQAAEKNLTNSYSPYSGFKVAAAVLSESGRVYTGVNIENASYGATCCAERTALFKAVSEGERVLEKIAVVSSSGGLTFPCGICRQVIAEFMPDGYVILRDENGNIERYTVEELLPHRFTL